MTASNFRLVSATVLAVVLVIIAIVGVDLAFAVAMTTTGKMFGMPWMAEISVLWLILAFWVLPKNWIAVNRRYQCKGSAIINAPLEDVWEEVRMQERGASYRPVVRRITEHPEFENRFVLHMDRRVSDDDTNLTSQITVEVTDSEPGQYLRLIYPEPETLPAWSRDIVSSEIFLAETDEGVSVTFVETLRRITVMTIFSLMFLNPCRDTASRLKARLEGTDDPSWMGNYMADMGADGSPPEGMKRSARIVTITACVTVTLIFAIIVTFIVSALPDR